MSMTRKAFKYDMLRGLGSCVLELRNTRDIEKFRPLVLWGCSRDMAYDAQSEGCRSVYLYQLITQFPDAAPFMDVLERRLYQCLRSKGWEFLQDCEVLSYFAQDGEKRAWDILKNCYRKTLQLLNRKRKYIEDGLADNFESLCVTLVTMRPEMYRMLVRDIGLMIESNSLYSASDFAWFQAVSESRQGKKAINRILYRPDAEDGIKAYARSMEEYRERWDRAETERRKSEPNTADEIYEGLKEGKGAEGAAAPYLARRMMNQGRQQEAAKLAAYYRDEKEPALRYQLLRMLANKACAGMLDVERLLADSRWDYDELAARAFDALSYIRDNRVREYAYQLLGDEKRLAQAVSLLAANYEDGDREVLVRAVKQIPITYEDGAWHGVFDDIMNLFSGPAKHKPKELLPYMYRNTLCSFCREYVVREMGRRRMLTEEMLEEMRYDCNGKIRDYAERKLGKGQGMEAGVR